MFILRQGFCYRIAITDKAVSLAIKENNKTMPIIKTKKSYKSRSRSDLLILIAIRLLFNGWILAAVNVLEGDNDTFSPHEKILPCHSRVIYCMESDLFLLNVSRRKKPNSPSLLVVRIK